MMREASSILPRLLRRPLTNMRQRRLATASSCERRWMLAVIRITRGAASAGQPAGRRRYAFASSQPRKLLGAAFSADYAQEYLFQRQLFAGDASILAGCGGLRFDSHAQFFERTLRDQASLMNDGDVAAQALDDFQYVRGQK